MKEFLKDVTDTLKCVFIAVLATSIILIVSKLLAKWLTSF